MSTQLVKPYYLWVRACGGGDLRLCLECVCGAFTFDVPTSGFACPKCEAVYAPPKERASDD